MPIGVLQTKARRTAVRVQHVGVEDGVASADDVNAACRLAFNHALGPLETIDFSGLDTALHAAQNMTERYGPRFAPPQLLRSLAAAGHLGRKTGRGFADFGGQQ
jgi:3-hydroxybutyryl-CoA dehydrogenase